MAKYNGRFSCEIHASNSVFGDPCYGSFKYLSVRYICIWKVNRNIWEVFLWSGSRLELWLGNGWKMALSNITKIQHAQDLRSPHALFGLLLQWYRLTLLACPFFCFSPFPKTENFISSYTRPPRNSAMYLVGIEKIAWKVFQFFLFYYRRGIKKSFENLFVFRFLCIMLRTLVWKWVDCAGSFSLLASFFSTFFVTNVLEESGSSQDPTQTWFKIFRE